MASTLRPPKLMKLTLFAFLIFVQATPSIAGAFNADAGYYSLEARTSNGTAKLENIGVYRLAYEMNVSNHISFRPGYTLYALGTSYSDLGYGLDIEGVFYPLTNTRTERFHEGGVNWEYRGFWHPYTILSFHQRQYQSIQSTYAGLGIGFGVALSIFQNMNAHVEAKGLGLKGPSGSRVGEVQILGGIGIEVE